MPMASSRVFGFHGAGASSVLTRNGGWRLSGQWVVVIEIVDQLLNYAPHRAAATAAVEEAADIGVRAGIHVDAEGRNRLFSGALDRVSSSIWA
jgi:hypothetical protein